MRLRASVVVLMAYAVIWSLLNCSSGSVGITGKTGGGDLVCEAFSLYERMPYLKHKPLGVYC